MTVTAGNNASAPAPEPAPKEQVTFVIDGIETTVDKGTLVIRAAEDVGIQIPRFCDHPLLKPVGACRQCLVEVATPDREGNVRPMPKPQTSCTLEASPGMVVQTQHTSPVADKAQQGQMEFLLINHPLDCPVCDKGGECPLQNQAMSNGRPKTRFVDIKRTFPKPIKVSTQILLDRERCVLCQRCTRFTEQIAGDHFISLQERGADQQIGVFDEAVLGFNAPLGDDDVPTVGAAHEDESGRPFASYFSGNTVQICPVGALTSAAYRFRSRPFDLVSSESIAEHDSCGAAIRVDHRRGLVMRRLAGNDPVVNEEWITDKDRFAFNWQNAPDRITTPLVRDRNADGTRGELRSASWVEAFEVAGLGLRAARDAGGVGVLPGGRLTIEDSYAYSKFARVALQTNDIDHRARPHSDEERDFLAAKVAGTGIDVTFTDLESSSAVLLVGLEPEEEAGSVFLRLRKGATGKAKTQVFSIAAFASRAIERMNGMLLQAAPGTEGEIIDALTENAAEEHIKVAFDAISSGDGIICVGERAAAIPGVLSAIVTLADRSGARVAWIPRRIGERAGVETGTLPGLLPGGRPISDAAARVDMAAAWDVDALPQDTGRCTDEILSALVAGHLKGLVIGGVELADLPDPVAARNALQQADFVVSLEVRRSEAADLADVVLPVAPPVERTGAFWNWEGRVRPFEQVLESAALTDHRVLNSLAAELDVDLGLSTFTAVRREIENLDQWEGTRIAAPAVTGEQPPTVGTGQAVLATWRMMLDAGRGQDGEPFLAGTARRAVARLSAATAAAIGVGNGQLMRVETGHGLIELPLTITKMPDYVVWVPTNSVGSPVRAALGVDAGALVQISAGPTTNEEA